MCRTGVGGQAASSEFDTARKGSQHSSLGKCARLSAWRERGSHAAGITLRP
jgi:hypothetical protein